MVGFFFFKSTNIQLTLVSFLTKHSHLCSLLYPSLKQQLRKSTSNLPGHITPSLTGRTEYVLSYTQNPGVKQRSNFFTFTEAFYNPKGNLCLTCVRLGFLSSDTAGRPGSNTYTSKETPQARDTRFWRRRSSQTIMRKLWQSWIYTEADSPPRDLSKSQQSL